ncbi:putative hydrocephalus-inducing-like protein, partial [Toxoplasma gondii ARI]
VVEIVSVGIGVKNTKRFFVLNPSSSDLDFEWEPLSSDSAPHSLKADAGGLASSQACRDRVASARCASPGAGTPRRTGFLPPVEGVRCVNLRGRIAAGRKTEVVLEFLPNKPKTQERLWKFCIPSRKLEQLFLFVGRVKEPHVALDCSSVCFNPVLLGGKVEEVVNIHNKEDIPLSFAFSRKQAESEKSPLPPCLVVSPRHGVLPPNSVTPVRLRFKPEDEKPFKCSLLCRVRQKVRPLSLGVRGAGYSVKHSMVLLNEDGSIRQFASGSQSASLLDFGPLLLGQTRRYLLQLQNAGSFDFRFHWSIQSVSTVSCSPSLSVSPTEGVVETGRNCEVTLTYAPAEISKHEEYLLLCSISGSDPYRIRAQGSCSSPKVSFSFSSHDFGAFVLPPSLFPDLGSVVALSSPSSGGSAISDRVELKITNLDPHHDCFISTPFEKSNVLDVQLVPCSIGPGEKISVTLIFAPKQAKNYRFKIPFSINDRTTAHVTVTGKGIPARLELSPSSDEIRFAPLIKGESAVKHVRIVNRTEASLEFFLPASPNLSSRGISWKPLSSETKPFSLHPRQELPLEVSFKPALSIPEFSLPLFAECLVKRGGLTYRFPSLLCHIAAKSFETEVRLSQPSLAFGPIVVNSWATQIVKLTNIGELFMHFKFKTSTKYSQMVSLSPSEGLLHPHADVPIEVTFRPTEVTQKRIVVDDIICLIKASGASASNVETSSLSLTVTGQGVAQPSDSVQTLQFSTAVRTQQTKTFQVKNSKKYDWSTTPLVACESPKDAMYFLCSPSGRVTIPANQKVTFQVTYSPLTMTRASSSVREGTLSAEEVDGVNRKEQRERGDGACNGHLADKDNHPRLPLFHAASVFIPLPDGEAATCRFIGQATEPTVEQVVDASIVCREKQIQAIKIRNWIPVKQKFDVAYTITQCTGDTPPQIQAPDRFELPASQAREYRFLASAFKPCAAVVQFRFTSREKADFYLAEARLTFTDPETVGTIALETTVRQLAKTKVLVENPSTRKAVFQCQSNVADVCFSPSPLEVPPGATGALEVSLRANVSGAGEGTIVLTSDELGTYKYLLKYSVSAGEIEKHATFSAPLGKEVSETLRFLHFAKKPTTYLATIDFAPDETRGGGRSKASGSVENFFLENKSVAVSGDVENRGTEFAVGVRFAPSKLAETKATLVLRSAEGFEYKALLIGRAQPPQPQGPFRLGKGKCINIDFRNPFETQTEFSLQVDRPCFSVEKKVVKLEARKSTTISVQVKPDARDAGRLIVTADGIPPWIFYLKAD